MTGPWTQYAVIRLSKYSCYHCNPIGFNSESFEDGRLVELWSLGAITQHIGPVSNYFAS